MCTATIGIIAVEADGRIGLALSVSAGTGSDWTGNNGRDVNGQEQQADERQSWSEAMTRHQIIAVIVAGFGWWLVALLIIEAETKGRRK